jgi:hypothetical protein
VKAPSAWGDGFKGEKRRIHMRPDSSKRIVKAPKQEQSEIDNAYKILTAVAVDIERVNIYEAAHDVWGYELDGQRQGGHGSITEIVCLILSRRETL